MKVIIDIGHANGTGARGNSLEEHAVSTVVAKYLELELGKMGHDSITLDFPRESNDHDLSLTVKEANTLADEWDIVVSLHCDWSSNPNAYGGHVCYLSGTGKRLAQCIARHLCALIPGRADKVVKRRGLYLLRGTKDPAVLCEMAFISNLDDAVMLSQYPDLIAKAIATGINDFDKQEKERKQKNGLA